MNSFATLSLLQTDFVEARLRILSGFKEKGEERKEGLEKEQRIAAINAVEYFGADSVRGLPYATSDHAEPGDGQQQFEPPWGVERNLEAL